MLTESQRAAQKAETRGRIVAIARRQYVARGSSALRTADVAKEAGLSHGAVFVHFPKREDLVRAVLGEIGRDLTDRLYALGRAGASLGELLRAHVKALAESEDEYRRLLIEEPTLTREERLPVVGVQSAIASHIAEVAAREMKAGRVRKMPHHLLFNTWIGLVHQYVLHPQLFAARGSVLEAHGATLVRHFMALVSAHGEPR